MKDADVARPSTAIWPVESARVNADVRAVDLPRRSQLPDWPRLFHCAEIIPPSSHRRQEVRSNRPPIPHVSDHNGLLHRPGIVADDKTLQSLVAVVAASRMILVHQFALCHEGIMTKKDSKRIPIQEEDQVRHLVRVLTIEIRQLWLAARQSEHPLIEAGNLLLIVKAVRYDPMQMKGNPVFIGQTKRKTGRWVKWTRLSRPRNAIS
jgi:hypothetical protein